MSDYIYDDGVGVRIDRGTAFIHGKTYSIQNINSVGVDAEQPKNNNTGCGFLLIVAGVLPALAALGSLMEPKGDQGPGGYAIAAILLIALGVFLMRRPRPPTRWRLIFTMSNGAVEAIASTDPQVVQRVRAAIEEAMRPPP
jgi:hypothetical protein